MNMQKIVRSINIVLVVGSALMTGIFGWTLANDNYLIGLILFSMFAALSVLSPVLWEFAAKQFRGGMWRVAGLAAAFASFFFAYDVVTNFGTSSLFRASEIVTADNQNDRAQNARAEVARLQKRISDIRATTAWQGKYNNPDAYDELIQSATKYIDLETRRGGCGSKCEERMRERDELVAAQANAQQREALKKEMLSLEVELKSAKSAAGDTPTVASAALTHATNIGAAFTGQMEPDSATKFWSNYGLNAMVAFGISLAGIVTSMMLGWISGPSHRGYEASDYHTLDERVRISVDPGRPAYTPPTQTSFPGQTVVVRDGQRFVVDDSVDRLLRDALARINNAPA